MKKIDLGQTVNTLANIGVIAGILLLVLELSQSREMMSAQLRADYAEMLIDQLAAVYTNSDLAEVLVEGGCEEMAPSCQTVDAFRYGLYYGGRFRSWENLHYQYRIGLYDETEFLTARAGWRNVLGVPEIQDAWVRVREFYSPEFVVEMNELLTN
jgi:hypothetical protein